LLQFVSRSSDVKAELREMLETAEVQQFKRGRVIIHEGAGDDRMYFLAAGKVEIRKGGMAISSLERLGDVFGEISAITGERRSATVVVKTDVTCLATDAGLVNRLSREGKLLFLHLLHQALSKVASGRLRSTSGDLVETKHALEEAKRENISLKATNAQLKHENEQLKKQAGGRLHWARRHGPDDQE